MKRLSSLIFLVACYSSLVFGVPSQEGCIKCHGPISELIKKGVQAEDDNGNKVNPHVLIPHNEVEQAKPMDCSLCHLPHPIPPKQGQNIEPASLEGCYTCHHNYQLKNCSNCHK